MSRPRRWRWIRHRGTCLYGIGVNPDGTLHNPNGYPEETVRAAIAGAEQRQRQKRTAAAMRAADTRRRRQEGRIYDVARRIAAGEGPGPASNCVICGRDLDDPDSIRRGVGSDCWQVVLATIEAITCKWRTWAQRRGIDPTWAHALARAGGSGQWHVTERPVPAAEWIEIISTRTGERIAS